jgi:hypothetical protein
MAAFWIAAGQEFDGHMGITTDATDSIEAWTDAKSNVTGAIAAAFAQCQQLGYTRSAAGQITTVLKVP